MAAPMPPSGRRARAPLHDLEAGGVSNADALMRAARAPAASLLPLPAQSADMDGRTTLALFVLVVMLIHTGMLHTLLWLALLGVAIATCFRVLLLLALMHSGAGELRAALAAAREADAEAGRAGDAAAPGGRLDPLVLQLQLLGRELTERDYASLLALDEDGGGGAPRRGLTRSQLAALPTHAHRADDADGAGGAADAAEGAAAGPASGSGAVVFGDGITCAVCLEEAAVGDVLRTLPCLHKFHAACIDRWLLTSDVCPVCKHRLLPPDP